MQALAILFGAVLTITICYAAGCRLLGSGCDDPGARFVTGAAAFSLVMFALCVLRLVYPAAILAIGVGAIWWARKSLRWPVKLGEFSYRRVVLVIVAFYFVNYFFNSMAPEWSFDGSAYHLGFVSLFQRAHGFERVTWNLYASLPEGAEMLFLAAFEFGRHSAAAMVHFAFMLALAWQVFSYGRRSGFALAGACGAMLVFCSPMFGVDGTSAYVDVALAAAAFTLFHLLELWDESRSRRLLCAIGLIAGFCFAIKYTGWVAVPYAFSFVIWRSRRWREAAMVAAAAALPVLPWMLKNWMWVGNPLAPFFNHYFPNPYFTEVFESSYVRQFSLYDLTSRWQIPMQVTTYGRLGGLLGPVFLLAPLSLLALRRREGRRLLFAAAVFGAGYFANIGTRFLIPSAVFVALALALVLVRIPQIAIAVVVLHALFSWPTRLPWYAAPNAWRLSKVPWRQALRIKPPEQYLHDSLQFYDVARMIDRSTPEGATVFTYRPIPEAYTSRRILVNYESEPNQLDGFMLQAAGNRELAPARQLRFPFPRQSLTAIRLTQTNTWDDQWKLNEVRLLDGRSAYASTGWRLDARPYRWNLEDAFDGRIVTLWRCGQKMHAQEYVEARFPQLLEADAVVVDTDPDQWTAQLTLEGRDPAGTWKQLSAKPEASETTPADLRRETARELRRRGVGYLLSFEQEAATSDLREHSEEYGIREVARNADARLYHLPPK